ncbi:UNKNOWN [Stylonychia lemnae]|uniref:Uncharacterized protein n=1 Tax=Stylonychia lemnae TaxID=5949 RepID=A0A078B4E6_STYLE|nr:UNKNOWN [Stylonychia lemnae]|eukprot:CDW89141.1 UNKNOWN [Stylonychia lemnae]
MNKRIPQVNHKILRERTENQINAKNHRGNIGQAQSINHQHESQSFQNNNKLGLQTFIGSLTDHSQSQSAIMTKAVSRSPSPQRQNQSSQVEDNIIQLQKLDLNISDINTQRELVNHILNDQYSSSFVLQTNYQRQSQAKEEFKQSIQGKQKLNENKLQPKQIPVEKELPNPVMQEQFIQHEHHIQSQMQILQKQNQQQTYKRPMSKDFKQAYNKLANQIIKQTLIDKSEGGRQALIINEKDIVEFEKQQNLEYFQKVQDDQNKDHVQTAEERKQQLRQQVAKLIEKDLQINNAKKKKKSYNSSMISENRQSQQSHHDLLYQKGVQKLENLKKMQELNDPEKKQLQECSFQPQFFSKPSQKFANRRRSMDEFYQDQIYILEKQNVLRQKAYDDKEQQLIEEKEKVISTAKHNEKYYSKLKGSFIYSEKESIKFQTQLEKQNAYLPSFTPQINEKSKKMKRSGSIESILYEDALERLNRRQSLDSQSTQTLLSPKYSLEKSDFVLAEKLTNEIQEQLFREFENDEIQITKQKFKQLLVGLGYYNESQSNYSHPAMSNAFKLRIQNKEGKSQDDLINWSYVQLSREKNYIFVRDFRAFIFALNNLYFDWMSGKTNSQPKNKKQVVQIKVRQEDLDSSQILESQIITNRSPRMNKSINFMGPFEFPIESQEQCRHMIINYLELVENRKLHLQNQAKNQQEQKKQQINNQSQLNISAHKHYKNPKSVYLAQVHYQQLSEEYQVNSHVDLLYRKQEEQKKRQEQMRKIKEDEEMVECSFYPKILNQSSADNDSRAKIFGSKKASMDDSHDIFSVKNFSNQSDILSNSKELATDRSSMDHLSKIKQSLKINYPGYNTQQPSNRSSSRIKDQKHVKQDLNTKEKSTNNFNKQIENPSQLGAKRKSSDMLRAIIKPDEESKISQFDINMVSIEEQTKDERSPILFLDVNLGGDEMSRIVIYENDDPSSVALKFAQENKLDEKKRLKLIQIIQVQMSTILPKIDEENE